MSETEADRLRRALDRFAECDEAYANGWGASEREDAISGVIDAAEAVLDRLDKLRDALARLRRPR